MEIEGRYEIGMTLNHVKVMLYLLLKETKVKENDVL